MTDPVTQQVIARARARVTPLPALGQSVPAPHNPLAQAEIAPMGLGTRLENYSIGLGQGLADQGEGLYQMVTNPVQTARGLYELGKYAVTQPGEAAAQFGNYVKEGVTGGPLSLGQFIGENIGFGGRSRQPVMQELTAYHASPHRFDKFVLSDRTIGTGEGAQAYGYGLYFAESPDVARAYKMKFMPNNIIAAKMKIILEEYNGDVQKAADRFMRGVYDTPKNKAKMREEVVKQMERGFNPHFYTVDLPDDQIAKMLDWDKPLSEQPESVRRAIKAIEPLVDDTDKGSDIYALVRSGLSGTHRNAQAAASEKLKQAGIPGIRYLDGSSRKAGEGTRNFVVFDDSILTILNRE